ncbi:cytochrome c oxidase assembly factor Coa1 family protein [Candidatus Riflebacteria bacterium]
MIWIVIFIILLFLLITFILKSSTVYKEALSKTKADARVVKILGSPIQEGFLVMGKIKNAWFPGGYAWLTIPISGPSGKGTLYVKATSDGQKWDMKLVVKIKATGDSIEVGSEVPGLTA